MPGRAAEIAVAIAGAVTYGGGSMTEAREVMDQLLDRDNWLTTVGLEDRDLEAAAKLLASDVVAVTPGVGQIEGRERLVDHTRQFMDAFPDLQYESRHKYESGNAAIDLGRYVGTNTGPLPLPSGESIPATGKIVKLRSCAIATVEGGLITHYEIYFDQMEMLGQLGLLPDQPDQ
jgi:ketosteroid isomerase-like protein